jgi:fido (protein-threonine AMPylation protein)
MKYKMAGLLMHYVNREIWIAHPWTYGETKHKEFFTAMLRDHKQKYIKN